MNELRALAFLNDTPYYFSSTGIGVELKFEGGKICIKRDNAKGGIDLSCNGNIFHFVLNAKTDKWGFPKRRARAKVVIAN